MIDPDASAALLEGLLEGREEARDRLVELWGPVVLRWCARLGGPGIDTEDAAHDAFERALERIPSVRDPRAFPGWLYQLTRNTVTDHRRQAWFRRWVPGMEPETPDASAGPERAAADADLARRVHAVIDRLPLDLREVLVLCEVEERNASEVAELVGVPLGTVKSRLRRARERFAVLAARYGLTPDTLASDWAEEAP